MRRYLPALSLVVSLTAGCRGIDGGALDQPQCLPRALTVDNLRAVGQADGTVRILGSVGATANNAVRSVRIVGREAHLDAFNYGAFSVTLDREAVVGLPRSCNGHDLPAPMICVHIEVTDACMSPALAMPDREVTLVHTLVQFGTTPASGGYVVAANGRAGLTVSITPTLPGSALIEPAPGSDGLARFDSPRGSAELPFDTATTPAHNIIGVRAGVVRLRVSAAPDADQLFDIVVASPPAITPSGGDVPAGATTTVQLDADAALDTCTVTMANDAGAMPFTGQGQHHAEISIAPLAGASTVVSCTDEVGQTSTATFTAM